jgi:hypothetical protein
LLGAAAALATLAATTDPAGYHARPAATPVAPVPLEATFDGRSAAAGATAHLIINAATGPISVQLFMSGPANARTTAADVMLGVAVGRPVPVIRAGSSALADVPLARDLPSGVYLPGWRPLTERSPSPRSLSDQRIWARRG